MRKTWFVDFDGTLVLQKSYFSKDDTILPQTMDFFHKIIKDEDYVIITTGRPSEHRERISSFMRQHSLRFDQIICDLPTGPRIVINDKKNDGTQTAYSFNLVRDEGINIEELRNSL